MSNEFEFKGNVTAVIGRGSTAYGRLLDAMDRSDTIQVMTFNLDEATLQLLAAAPETAQRTLICNIPNRFDRYFNDEARSKARQKIAQYAQLLRQYLSGWHVYVCAKNHAKVFRCDEIAYVGSANLTASHAANFEAGFIVRGPQVEEIVNALIEDVLAADDCIPFFGSGSNQLVDAVFALAASLEVLAHRVSCRTNFEDDAGPWDGPPSEPEYLTSDDLSEIAGALENMEAEWMDGPPEFKHFADTACLRDDLRRLVRLVEHGEDSLVAPSYDVLVSDAVQDYLENGDHPDDTECINAAAHAAASEQWHDWENSADSAIRDLLAIIESMRSKCAETLRSFQSGDRVDNT